MFRVTKQARAILAELHDELCQKVATILRDNLLDREMPDDIRAAIDRAARPETFKDDQVFRVVLRDDQPSLKPDKRETIASSDKKFMHDEKVILVVDQTLSQSLEDLTLDIAHSDSEPRVSFRYHCDWRAV